MPEERTLDLVDRLRGKYVLPVNDGAGPLNGKTTFTREFETPPIHHEAAAEIERLRGRLRLCQGDLREHVLTPKFDERTRDCIGFTCDLCGVPGENENQIEHDEGCALLPEKP